MKSNEWIKPQRDRRFFIGGSDARIIMGNDEAALLRLMARKTRARRSQRTSRATSSSSSVASPRTSIGAGTRPIPAKS